MMSNTAVSRRADDIQAAGGNRALAFTNGQEATTPSVAAANVQPTGQQAADLIGNLGPKIWAAKAARQSILQSSAQVHLTTEQARMVADQAANIRADTLLKLSTGNKTEQETRNLEATNRKIALELEGMASDNAIKKIQSYIAEHTRDEAIRKIQADTLLTELHIDPAQVKSTWAKIKNALFEALSTNKPPMGEPRGSTVRYGDGQ